MHSGSGGATAIGRGSSALPIAYVGCPSVSTTTLLKERIMKLENMKDPAIAERIRNVEKAISTFTDITVPDNQLCAPVIKLRKIALQLNKKN